MVHASEDVEENGCVCDAVFARLIDDGNGVANEEERHHDVEEHADDAWNSVGVEMLHG